MTAQLKGTEIAGPLEVWVYVRFVKLAEVDGERLDGDVGAVLAPQTRKDHGDKNEVSVVGDGLPSTKLALETCR